MSKKYDEYLEKHIHGVQICYKLLTREDLPSHDDSKFTLQQYVAYDNHFYPEEQDVELDALTIERAYDLAWNDHQKQEKHHWQYWVLLGDSGYTKPLEMPERYVYEMVADWASFSFNKKNGQELVSWYEKNKNNMMLHVETRILVNKLVPKMANIIDEYFKEKSK